MSNFNKGARSGAGGGRGKFEGNRFGKPAFAKKSWGDKRSGGGDRPVTLYNVTCANCHKSCEVPFRPNGEKPVYCKDCFENKGGRFGDDRGDSRFPGRDFGPRGTPPPLFEVSKGSDDIKRQLESVNLKLERLIKAVERMAPAKPDAEVGELKDVIASAMKKKKKTTPKK